jgi:hypothetical protein
MTPSSPVSGVGALPKARRPSSDRSRRDSIPGAATAAARFRSRTSGAGEEGPWRVTDRPRQITRLPSQMAGRATRRSGDAGRCWPPGTASDDDMADPFTAEMDDLSFPDAALARPAAGAAEVVAPLQAARRWRSRISTARRANPPAALCRSDRFGPEMSPHLLFSNSSSSLNTSLSSSLSDVALIESTRFLPSIMCRVDGALRQASVTDPFRSTSWGSVVQVQ